MDHYQQFSELTELGQFRLQHPEYDRVNNRYNYKTLPELSSDLVEAEATVQTRFAFATTPITAEWAVCAQALRDRGWSNLGNRLNSNTSENFIALWWKRFAKKGAVKYDRYAPCDYDDTYEGAYPPNRDRFEVPGACVSSEFCCGLQIGSFKWTRREFSEWRNFPYLQIVRLENAPASLAGYSRIGRYPGRVSYWTNAGRNFTASSTAGLEALLP